MKHVGWIDGRIDVSIGRSNNTKIPVDTCRKSTQYSKGGIPFRSGNGIHDEDKVGNNKRDA